MFQKSLLFTLYFLTDILGNISMVMMWASGTPKTNNLFLESIWGLQMVVPKTNNRKQRSGPVTMRLYKVSCTLTLTLKKMSNAWDQGDSMDDNHRYHFH